MCRFLPHVTAVGLRYPQRLAGSPSLPASTKASHMFSEPLASEGEGSVFPVGLPLSKRFVKAEACSVRAGVQSVNFPAQCCVCFWSDRDVLFTCAPFIPGRPCKEKLSLTAVGCGCLYSMPLLRFLNCPRYPLITVMILLACDGVHLPSSGGPSKWKLSRGSIGEGMCVDSRHVIGNP